MIRSRRINSFTSPALVVLFTSVFLFSQVAYAKGYENPHPLSVNEQIIAKQSEIVSEKSASIEAASQKSKELEAQKAALASQIESDNQKITELKHQIAVKLAAKQAAEQAAKAQVRTAVYTPSAPVSSGQGPMTGCGDNEYAAYIYGQESGGRVTGHCNPSSVNPGGCRGIGQACPGSKLPCGADYACQNAYFNNYAISAYGSWANAYNFHRTHGWW